MRDLDLLGTFLEIYRQGSISGAAAALGMSQPAVSERLARLEAQLAAALFDRSSRGVTPTATADRLAARITDPIDRLRQATSDPGAPTRGTVRIGGASDVIASRVIPALAPLTFDGISFEFTLGLAPSLIDALARGRLDLVIASQRHSHPEVRYRGLVDEEFVLVGAPLLAASMDKERLRADPAEALGRLPLVAYDSELSIVRRYWRSQFGGRPANPVSIVVPDLRGILAAVVAGAGISALPRYLADPALAAGQLEILHRPLESTINTLHLAVPARAAMSPSTNTVIARLLAKAKEWDSL